VNANARKQSAELVCTGKRQCEPVVGNATQIVVVVVVVVIIVAIDVKRGGIENDRVIERKQETILHQIDHTANGIAVTQRDARRQCAGTFAQRSQW
jgi:hypothetical protein